MAPSRTPLRPNEPPMPEPVAFLLTWTTYGTWLPGDERGWIKWGQGVKLPDPVLRDDAAARMVEPTCTLDAEQRRLVDATVADHCRIRGWQLHAVSCRSNHVHVVVSAECNPVDIRDQFKAWCTRKLKERQQRGKQAGEGPEQIRQKWWTERGSQRYIADEDGLEAAILYVLEAQDRKDRDP